MRDIIALLPQPGPIVTFQKVSNILSVPIRLHELTSTWQFANKKVGNIRKNSAGVPSDILSMIVSI